MIETTLKAKQLEKISPALRKLFADSTAVIRENYTLERMDLSLDALSPEQLSGLLGYRAGGSGVDLSKTQRDLSQVISNTEGILTLAEECGVRGLQEFRHGRLNIIQGDAEWWAGQNLTGRELAARFVARRLFVELTCAHGAELPTQGDLSYWIGDATGLEAKLVSAADAA